MNPAEVPVTVEEATPLPTVDASSPVAGNGNQPSDRRPPRWDQRLLGHLPRSRRYRHPMRVPALFAAPGTLAYVLFTLGPVLFACYYAFTDWNGSGPSANFVGLENVRNLFDDDLLSGAVYRTVLLGLGFAVTINVVGLSLALALNRGLRSRNFLRGLFLAPAVVSPLAIGYVWKYMLQPTGAVNEILGWLHLDSLQQIWLADPELAMLAVLSSMVWQSVGLNMIIYLAGLQSISSELYEAASVDGASVKDQFRYITFPLLAPAFTANVLLSVIFGLRTFEQVLSLTGGGPAGLTETMGTTVYKQVFQFDNFGAGATTALAMTLLMLVVALPLMVILRRREER